MTGDRNDSWMWCQGDIIFLHMSKAPIRAGEIVVFHVDVCSFSTNGCTTPNLYFGTCYFKIDLCPVTDLMESQVQPKWGFNGLVRMI